jgi:phosphoserine phosphatase
MPSKKPKDETLENLKNSEKKYQSYIQRRNELNDMAKILREERDMLNAKHREMRERMQTLKKERDDLVAKMRHYKELRNKLQEKAKQLIDAKRKRKGQVFKNLPLQVEELKADVQMMEYRQETVPMDPKEERELVEKIRVKRREYEKTKHLLEKQKEIEIDISDKDKAIDDLFKQADEHHKLVQQYYKENQEKHEEYIKCVRELSVQISEANKKHEEYIEVKNEAQRNHERAIEMRSKIISIRNERRKRWEDAKKAIEEQNVKARKATVMDEEKMKEFTSKSVDELRHGKKISL